MPIVLSGNQGNVSTSSTPLLQDWYLEPGTLNINYYQGQGMPAAVTVFTQFKDVIGSNAYQGYSNHKYKIAVEPLTNVPQCVVVSGPLQVSETVYAPYTNGLNGNMSYQFQNLNLLTPGVYTFTVTHTIRATVDNDVYNYEINLSVKEYKVVIRVYSADVPVVGTSGLEYVWVIGQQSTVSKSFSISAPVWRLVSPIGFTFQYIPGTLVSQLPDGSAAIQGTGTKTITMIALHAIEPAEITDNPLALILDVNGHMLDIPVNVTFVTVQGLFLSRNALHFSAYKGISEALVENVLANYNGTFKITGPAWCIVPSGTFSNSKKFDVGVLSTSNMAVGYYSGVIEFRAGSSGELIGIIAVTYDVIGSIVSPYNGASNAYTLDRKNFEFVSNKDDIYFDILLKIRAYNFYDYTFKDVELPFMLPLFMKKQVFNVGLIVDRIMYRKPDISNTQISQYQAAEVTIDFTEKSNADASYQKKYSISNLKFVAGLAPKLTNGYGLLDINPEPSRVTAKSIAYVNLISAGLYNNDMYINGVKHIELVARINSSGVKSHRLVFSRYGVKPGDVLEYRISNAGVLLFTKTFLVFPEGYNSNMILWENEFKLTSAMEFTGKYQVKNDFDNRTATLNELMLDTLQKLESTKTATLTINTGHILKSDISSVESLCRSKRAMWIIGDRKINLVPTQKTLITTDDDLQLISFDIEFQINRSYNEEIYSF